MICIEIKRHPNDQSNFTGEISSEKQLERILKKLRNQYERLVSSIPNSFL